MTEPTVCPCCGGTIPPPCPPDCPCVDCMDERYPRPIPHPSKPNHQEESK